MVERILGTTTHQQIRTSDVALQFELLLLTVVCCTGEQAHDGSAMKVRFTSMHHQPSGCYQKVANDVLRKKKTLLRHLLGICATVDTVRVNTIGFFHDQNTQHVAWQRDPNKN